MPSNTSPDSVYAMPRIAARLDDCHFYHTMDLPGYGTVQGEWDLRDTIAEYLGNEKFEGKRVLDVGAASGFVSFCMERMGAEVVGFDLSEEYSWNIIPYARVDHQLHSVANKVHIRMVNNSFWFARRAYGSNVDMVYGDVYHVPEAVGAVDMAVYGSILLHLRDPFCALRSGLKLVREKVVIVDMPPASNSQIEFLPDFKTCRPLETWWRLSPEVVQRFIGILGFEESVVTYSYHKCAGKREKLYTVVGRRTITL